MVLELTVGYRFWCPCGWTVKGERGASVLASEHVAGCSWVNRRGHGKEFAKSQWWCGLQVTDRTTRRFWRSRWPDPRNV